MPEVDEFDGRFSLPAVDDPPLTEAGMILMGLDAERLLAGLGLATLFDAPTQVALAVDQAKHDALRMTLDALIEAGVRTWSSARPAIATANQGATPTGSLRRSWAQTLRTIPGHFSPASRAYLTACWLRRTEIDKQAGLQPEK